LGTETRRYPRDRFRLLRLAHELDLDTGKGVAKAVKVLGESALNIEREPWEKQPNEPARAFEAFAVYRDLGASRSLAKAGQILGKSKTTLEEWSRKHAWQHRIDAWEAHLDRRLLAERETRQMQVDREQMDEGRWIRVMAIRRLTGSDENPRSTRFRLASVRLSSSARCFADFAAS
jgi:hypothetical protein